MGILIAPVAGDGTEISGLQNEERRTMRKFAAVLLMGFFATAAIAKSHVPSKNTHAAIKAYVKQAAAVVAKKGPSCDAFSGKDWSSGDYYIFVLGPDEKILCHPNASLIGKNNLDVTDANGKKI